MALEPGATRTATVHVNDAANGIRTAKLVRNIAKPFMKSKTGFRRSSNRL